MLFVSTRTRIGEDILWTSLNILHLFSKRIHLKNLNHELGIAIICLLFLGHFTRTPITKVIKSLLRRTSYLSTGTPGSNKVYFSCNVRNSYWHWNLLTGIRAAVKSKSFYGFRSKIDVSDLGAFSSCVNVHLYIIIYFPNIYVLACVWVYSKIKNKSIFVLGFI